MPSSMTLDTMAAVDIDLTTTEQFVAQSSVNVTAAAATAAATASSPSSGHAVSAKETGGSLGGWGSSQGKAFLLLSVVGCGGGDLQLTLHANS